MSGTRRTARQAQSARRAGGAGASTGSGHGVSSVRFAAIARRLSAVARSEGVDAPGFRSPPRAPGLTRSIKRESDGSATVSVALRGRPELAVMGDMVDGVVAAAGLAEPAAAHLRDRLWAGASELVVADDEPAEPASFLRWAA